MYFFEEHKLTKAIQCINKIKVETELGVKTISQNKIPKPMYQHKKGREEELRSQLRETKRKTQGRMGSKFPWLEKE